MIQEKTEDAEERVNMGAPMRRPERMHDRVGLRWGHRDAPVSGAKAQRVALSKGGVAVWW